VTESRTEAPLPRPVSATARRQRRCRERRRRGAIVVQFAIAPGAISDLVRLGWLDDSNRGNRRAVRDAVVQFASWAISHA
jgi:hypothetical protein